MCIPSALSVMFLTLLSGPILMSEHTCQASCSRGTSEYCGPYTSWTVDIGFGFGFGRALSVVVGRPRPQQKEG